LRDKDFPNAKAAMTRVVLECVIKYVAENTKYKGKKISDYGYFKGIFPTDGGKSKYTNFKELKDKLIELINTRHLAIKNALRSFDIDDINQTIHNFYCTATKGKEYCDNLIPIIEFFLDEEQGFLNSLDLTKLEQNG
jgi:hypothetical protein